ncbi:eosinophil cationic protein-like [Thomomys bottae]
MGPGLLGCRAAVLLGVMVLMGMLTPSEAPPPGFTPTQWFETQHINMVYPQCNAAMTVINGHTGVCKNKNTFLHTSYVDAARVCNTSITRCRNPRQNNCHDSPNAVDITDCDLIASVYPNCNYRQTQAVKFYTIACDPKTPRDTVPYPVVPVHLDKTF